MKKQFMIIFSGRSKQTENNLQSCLKNKLKCFIREWAVRTKKKIKKRRE